MLHTVCSSRGKYFHKGHRKEAGILVTRKQAIAPELLSFMSSVHSPNTLSLDTLGVYAATKVAKTQYNNYCVTAELEATLE